MTIRQIKTLNSTYEVDLVNERVRRVEGKNASVMPYGDGEWHDFLESRKTYLNEDEDRYVWFFFFPKQDQGWLRTSIVQSEELIEHV